MGWLGGSTDWANMLFEPGPIGVISRSGGQSGTVPWALKVAGLGISTALHIGTEPVLGLSMADVLKMFEADDQTRAVAIFGEIGGTTGRRSRGSCRQGRVYQTAGCLHRRRLGPRGHAVFPCQQHC